MNKFINNTYTKFTICFILAITTTIGTYLYCNIILCICLTFINGITVGMWIIIICNERSHKRAFRINDMCNQMCEELKDQYTKIIDMNNANINKHIITQTKYNELITQIQSLQHQVWLEDIESPTCSEYIEHHESIQRILLFIKDILKLLEDK